MRVLLTAAATSLLLAGPVFAQAAAVEGNWACTALIDGTKAGILTIFGNSYGYASATFGSTASGTGTVQLASDGVTFLDGSFVTVGIGTGLLSFDETGADLLTLYNPEKPVLSCTPR